MASIRSSTNNRRSRSASNTLSVACRSPDDALRIATKRSCPIHAFSPASNGSPLQKWDIESWRRGKRRRRDTPSPDVTMNYVQDQHKHDVSHSVISSGPVFPTSPADFNILPKSDRSSRRRASCPSPRSDNNLPNMLNHTELTRLRSDAFWELHRSVAENGEGFVQRMRDYERIRSRQAPDTHRKSRRRIFNSQLPMNTTYPSDSDISDDDDDVQIFAGEVSGIQNPRPCHDRWAFSRDVLGLYQSENGHSEDSRYPTRPCSSLPLTYHLDSEGLSMPTGSTSPTPPSTTPSSLSSPAQSQLADINNCFVFSPSTPPSSSFVGRSPSVSAERAVSDLTLALANGAGSISDYTCLENLSGSQQLDAGQPGELWH